MYVHTRMYTHAHINIRVLVPSTWINRAKREREREFVKLAVPRATPIRMTSLFSYLTSGSGVHAVNGVVKRRYPYLSSRSSPKPDSIASRSSRSRRSTDQRRGRYRRRLSSRRRYVSRVRKGQRGIGETKDRTKV